MKYILLLLLALFQVILAIILGYKKHSKVSRTFIIFAINIALWTAANIILDYYQYQLKGSAEVLDIVNKIAFFLGTLSLVVVYRMSQVFPIQRNENIASKTITMIGLGVPLLTLFPVISGYFIYSGQSDTSTYINGDYIFIVGLYTLLISVASIKNTFNAFKSVDSLVKKQATTLFAGLISSIIIGVFFTTILPTVTGSEEFLFLGYYAPFIFTASLFYSIVRQQFLDFRFIITRSLAYIFSLGSIVLITAFVIFGLSNWLVEAGVSQNIRLWLYVILTLFFSVSYQPIKRLFDTITSKLFYRDAYDTQIFLNEFNQVIVSTIDLNQLLARAGTTIEKYLKPETVAFAIRDSDADTLRIVSNEDANIPKEAVEQIRAYVHKNQDKLIATDALEENQSELKQLLQEANIGMLVRVTTDVSVEGNGYILMGYKKSGNMYNTQDTGAMEIVANELAIAMQNALQFEEIQKFNVTLQEKVDDATKQLRKSNEKLKQMDETKDEFISMASHQLRTPLTSVKGYVSMVIEGDAGELNDMQKKLLDQAFVSSQRMVYLIADLLNVSRLRTGKFVIESAPTNLADVIQGEVEQLVETAESRGLELIYQKPKEFPMLMLDETKIRQVIMNFIDNAIYYTPNGGHIKVELKDTGKTVEYTVTDDGLGVPKAEQHHLFSKFFRAGNAKKARPDGTGLGLFMAKKVIVAQGGSIIFKSTEGKGSTFGFSFDKAKMAVPDHYEAPEEINGIKFGPNNRP